MKKSLFTLLALLLICAPVNATILDVTWNPQAGDAIKSADVRTTIAEIEASVNNIESDQIVDSTITGADIANGTITSANLATSVAGYATIGSIQMYAGTSQTDTMTTAGWFICDGRALSRTTYATLYSIIGTTYGIGNGSTTFNVPDFRARTAVGACTTVIPATPISDTRSIRTTGDSGGYENVTLDTTQMPAHQGHSIVGYSVDPGTTASLATFQNAFYGNGQPHSNMPPYLVVNFIIYAGKL